MSTDFPLFGKHRNRQNLQKHFLAQKAMIAFTELEPFYMQGAVIKVASSLDLVEVALVFALDESEQVERWLANGTVQRLQKRLLCNVHALVVSPWVLVQEVNEVK